MSGDDLINPGITHVIFDMDGLLLDTERLYTEATQQLCDRFGKVYTFDMKRQVMGKTGASAAQAVIDLVGIPITPEEYIKEINQVRIFAYNCLASPTAFKYFHRKYKKIVQSGFSLSSLIRSIGNSFYIRFLLKLLRELYFDLTKYSKNTPVTWS